MLGEGVRDEGQRLGRKGGGGGGRSEDVGLISMCVSEWFVSLQHHN